MRRRRSPSLPSQASRRAESRRCGVMASIDTAWARSRQRLMAAHSKPIRAAHCGNGSGPSEHQSSPWQRQQLGLAAVQAKE